MFFVAEIVNVIYNIFSIHKYKELWVVNYE